MSAYLFYVHVRLISLVVGVSINAFTLFLIIYNSKLRAQRNIFTFNLALADFVAATCEIVRATLISGDLVDCTQVIFHCGILVSVMSVLAVACYRFIAIAFDPFGSRNLVTTQRCVVGSGLMWVVVTVPLMLLFYCSSVYRAVLFTMMPIIILTSLAITTFCYCMTYRDISNASGKQSVGGADQIKGRVKENRKVLLTFAVITLTSSVCWIVHCFHDILQIYEIYYDNIDAVSNLLVALNFIIDPVIYWWRLDEFRAVLMKMFCKGWLARRLKKAAGRVEDNSSSSSKSGAKIFSMADSVMIVTRASSSPSISEM